VFCVECGREGELIGSLCKDCYSKKHVQPSIPDHVDVTICAHCSSMLTEIGWKDVGSIREAAGVAIEHALQIPKGAKVSEMRIKLDEKDERNLAAVVSVIIAVQGHDFERELSTIVRLKRGSCTECSKKQGNYYEAILQVRGPERSLPEDSERDIERLVRERVASMRKGSREIFVSKIEHVKGGLDFYFSTIPAARTVARGLQETLCSEFKESSSLWGRRDGKDIYRMTYLVRLPSFSKGDVIDFQGREYFIRGMSRGIVHGIDLRSGEERSMKIKESGDCALVKSGSEILKAVVLIDRDEELQVLDPETMSPLDVKKPIGFSRGGDQVRLVKTKVGAFVLSDSW
jgi:nonsense-mediated mRNA decay protein 3